jgi:MFS family permease
MARTSRNIVYLAAFGGAAVATGLGRAVVTTYLPLLLQEIRDAPGLIGTVLLVNAAAGFLVPLVVGRWRDRRREGRRLPLLTGGALLTAGGLVAIALGSGTTYAVLAATGAIAYVGLNVVTTAYRALVPVLFAAETQARANSMQEAGTLVGTLAGVVAGGALTELASWAPFVLAAIVVPALTLLTVVVAGESRGAGRRQGFAFTYYLRAAAKPGVRALLAAQLLWVFAYAALPAFFILYAKEVLDLEPSAASLGLAGFGAATGLSILAAGRVRDPSWHKPLVALGVALMGSGFLAVSAATDPTSVAFALVAPAIGFGVVSTLGFPLFAMVIPAGEEGSYTALFFASRAIASAIALPAAGWVIAASNSYRALFVWGGLAAFAALVPLAAAAVPGARPLAIPVRNPLLQVALGIAGLWIATLVFGLLAAQTELEDADHWLFRRINEHGTGPDLFWAVINPHLRNYVVLAAIPIVLAFLTRRWRPTGAAAVIVSCAAISLLFLYTMYDVWDRPRPEEVFEAEEVRRRHSYSRIASYPSGHLVVTAALAGAATRLFPALRIPVWIYVAVVGLSRVLFGSHFPSDVVAGVALGYGSAYFTWRLIGPIAAQSTRRPSRTGRKELRSPR